MGATTPTLALPFPQPADSNNVPQDIQNLATRLDLIAVSFLRDVAANRPNSTAPAGVPAQGNYVRGTQGRWFYATDTGILSYDFGGGWLTIPSVLTLVTTKGDLLVAQANAAMSRLGVGGDGQVLTARSGAQLGIDWETQIGQPMGLAGAATATRFVGATSTNGPPSSGTFTAGDFVICPSGGRIWICQISGSPGTWLEVGSQAPGFTAYMAGQNIPTYYYYNIVGWSSAGFDTHSAITSSGYVIPKSGWWWFGYCVAFSQASSGQRYARLVRNGDPSGGAGGPGFTFTTASSYAPSSSIPTTVTNGLNYPVYLNVGDVIGVQCAHSTGYTISLVSGTVDDGTLFSGRWLHS